MTLGTETPFFEADERGIRRAAVVGSAIAAVIIWTFVALVAMYAGAHLGESIAMGAFAALFGGPGFGGMLGAVTYIERQHAASSKLARVVASDAQDTDGSSREPRALALEPVREKIHLERAEPVSSAR
jgi:hypothetical protein